MDSVPAPSPATAPDPVSNANHKSFVPHIPRKNSKKRRRMRGVITDQVPRNQSNYHHSASPGFSGHHNTFRNDDIDHDDRRSTNPARSYEPAEKAPTRKNYTWHRQQTLPLHGTTTAELDDTWAEGHLQSKGEDTSRNDRQFDGPTGSCYSYPHHDSFQSQRDSCYRLWKQLDDAYDARERRLSMKEEDLARREQAVRTREELITHWTAQAQAERLEIAYIRQQAIMLKEQVDTERCKLETEAKRLETLRPDMEPIILARIANESPEDADKIFKDGQTLHVKTDLSKADYHYSERIAGQSGEGTNMKVMSQNCHSTMEEDADERFEAMRGSSQECVDTYKAKLDISAKAPECLTETFELCESSSFKVTNSVSEKGNDPEQQHTVSNEIVNRAVESPAIFSTKREVIGDSERFPSETDNVDVCKEDLRSSVNDKESSFQPSRQSREDDNLCQIPPFQSLLCADRLKPEESEVHLNNTERLLPTPSIATLPIKVKVENVEYDRETPLIPLRDNFPNVSLQTLKVKSEALEDCESDELDHISLQSRQKLCKTMIGDMDVDMEVPKIDILKGECDSGEAQKPRERNFSIKRNKKKTKICSVETALEEDAPGLLQVLREKGFIDEIKLYGDSVNGDLLGLAAEEDNFEELENVIEKLWGRPSGLVKMGRMRQIGANKPTYCLACLLSLIEQTRSLQLRKWPVEWGWCRQLQSFIFVFERHNRIVLERPEYGYATYFFELVQALPIKWQVGRLVTVMSVAICSRTALLENKPLEIGDDLTSEEATILEDYGWTPNSGFGSLLNYCDRVVHDRKVDDDDMEWRSKIGKMLMDGHAHGSISITNFPKKLQNIIPAVKCEE